MPKLSLVIADSDVSYIRGLSGYINSNHSTAFQVSCFTKAESFIGYMEQQSEADVLLISPDFYDLSMRYENFRLKLILSTGALSQEYEGFQTINKYGTGEKLLSEVVHLYSKFNPSELRFPAYSKNTKFVGVYSPAGGAGKTTIASALSIQCNELGMRSFYMNLESIQSTGVFFNLNNKRNLSYVFYYLKEKSNNLSFKMDGIKSTEACNGVEYFNPPESPMEYEEISVDELKQLVEGIKEMGCYDIVFIDMSSTFDKKNYKIMNLCDQVILVVLEEPISLYKNKMLLNELVKLSEADKGCVSEKFITVINKYRGRCGEGIESIVEHIPAEMSIPEYSRAFIREDGKVSIDDEDFRKAINRLIGIISDK